MEQDGASEALLAPPLLISSESEEPPHHSTQAPPSTNSLGSIDGLFAAAASTALPTTQQCPTTQQHQQQQMTTPPPSDRSGAKPGGQRKFSPAQRMLESPAPQFHPPPPLHIIGPHHHHRAPPTHGSSSSSSTTAPVLVIPRHQTPTRASAARGVSPVRCRAGPSGGYTSPLRSAASVPSPSHQFHRQHHHQPQQLRSQSPRAFSSPYSGGGVGGHGGAFAFPKPPASPTRGGDRTTLRSASPAGPASRQFLPPHHQQQQAAGQQQPGQQRPGSPSYMMATQASALKAKARAPSPVMHLPPAFPAAFGPSSGGGSSRPSSRSNTPVRGATMPPGSVPASPVRAGAASSARDSSATRRRREAMTQHQPPAGAYLDSLSKRPRLGEALTVQQLQQRGALARSPAARRTAYHAAGAPRAAAATATPAPTTQHGNKAAHEQPDPAVLVRSLGSLSLAEPRGGAFHCNEARPPVPAAAGMGMDVAASPVAAAVASVPEEPGVMERMASTREEIEAVLARDMLEYQERNRFQLPETWGEEEEAGF